MAQKFGTLIGGLWELVEGLVASAGSGDAGKIVALGADGRLDDSVMPVGIGADTQQAVAMETLGAGKYVQFHNDSGVFSVRLADNSNNRPADGFVLEEFSASSTATVYPLDSTNTALSGLTMGSRYWLGTAGGVIAVPLEETDAGNNGKVSQYLGKAKSTTELITTDSDPVVL
ncbi:hypothetical protein EQ826_01790 [Ectopseudomonas mendocina]|nr:hypothetical protein [Pseudomonas mendocina]TRO18439.1 hypothetical protein EQ828_18330 [Pseudomonas mendocina]TRO29633.1 hypothetical protein EQ826_01790 [Pseudomonas mendocina]